MYKAILVPMSSEPSRNIHRIFIVSLVLKTINAFLELAVSFVFLFTGSITAGLSFIVQNEVVRDRDDVFADFFRHSVLPHLSSHSQLFVATYLLIHGAAKIFVVAGLLSRRIWAYKAAEFVLCAFIAYQMYEYALIGSFWLVFLSAFDTALLWLTWREHQTMRSKIENAL